jgi:GMP synthase-like glutamine amidotransferase
MTVLVVVNQEDAGPGVFGDVLAERNAEVVEWRSDEGGAAPSLLGVDSVVVLGGAAHPHQVKEFTWLERVKRLVREVLEFDVPTLGVCLGAELVAEALGAEMVRLPQPEIGWFEITASPGAESDPVFGALPASFTAFQWHSYGTTCPLRAFELASGSGGPNAFRAREAWGIQFHPEVTSGIVGAWLDGHENDEDAVAAGFDPGPVRVETAERIAESEQLGRALVGAFLDYSGVT